MLSTLVLLCNLNTKIIYSPLLLSILFIVILILRNYSKRNTPLPAKWEYNIQLIAKVESAMKGMILKPLEFFSELSSSKMVTYGFQLMTFESDLSVVIKNIKFRKLADVFQSKLQKDIKASKKSKSVFLWTDKWTNIYVIFTITKIIR